MNRTSLRQAPILLLVLLVSAVGFAQDVEDAPLEDVWPAMAEPQFGDLDAMVQRGEIRILTAFTLGSYFIDRGRQHGTVFEMSRLFEKYARDKLGKAARTLKVTIIPVRRDQLIPFLIAGHGDVAFANLTITPERRELVDFSTPFTKKSPRAPGDRTRCCGHS
jgi:ABC-type amino acid transport substrate-binding protein